MKFEVIFQCSASLVVGLEAEPREGCGVAVVVRVALDLAGVVAPAGNCIKIGLPEKLILSKRKGLREVLFS